VAVFDLYSKRKKRASGKQLDVYTYDKLPKSLKVQIIHVWGDTIGAVFYFANTERHRPPRAFQQIVDILRREAGVFKLSDETVFPQDEEQAYPELCRYFLAEKQIDADLDVVELTCKYIENVVAKGQEMGETAQNAIIEVNTRFDEHGIGYQYADGTIICRTSEYIHNEAVKPVLLVLRNKIYETAQQEFLHAYEHYRDGKTAECLVDACKAFESTMKIICTKRQWPHGPNMTASQLIQVCLRGGLIPPYWQAHFTSLRGLLEASIPTARNKQGGHGAGVAPPHNPPRELVAYVLHMTASTILFLTEAEKALP
jgi:AbiJ N-terminal domain 4